MTEMGIEKLATACAAVERVVGGAEDRDVPVTGPNAVVGSGVDNPVIAVHRGQDLAVRGQ